MSQNIKTMIHILAESTIYNSVTKRDEKIKQQEPMHRMMGAHHFVIQDEAIELMTRSDVAATIQALHDAKLTRLPYPSVLIEFDETKDSKLRHFVLLEELSGHDAFKPTWGFYDMKQEFGGIQIIPAKLAFHQGADMEFTYTAEGDLGWQGDLMKHGASVCRMAADICFMLLNTKGIEKEVITCEPLNKQRKKRGKATIPRHSYVHLSRVYRVDGSYQNYNPRIHRKMHLRKGHVRNQRFGPGLEETRVIYIEPILVNYDPDQKIEKKIKVVTK